MRPSPISAARKALLLIAAAACCLPAHAYGPFDGTDASVVQPGLFELEIGAGYQREAGQRAFYLPALVANFGLPSDTEVAIEGRYQRPLGDGAARASLGDTAFTVKHLFRRGSLQDLSGPSIAAECKLLLPGVRSEPAHGAGCTGVLSQRWEQGAVHLNAGFERTSEHGRERFAGVIVEGPEAWPVRPVAELIATRAAGAATTRALLLGAIWKRADEISFHLAVRRELAGGERADELRFGLTWPLGVRK